MGWTIEFDKKAKKELASISSPIQKQIDKFLLKLGKSANPRVFGDALKGNLRSFWRYRVGDYRIICQINDKEIIVLILSIAHRKEVYL